MNGDAFGGRRYAREIRASRGFQLESINRAKEYFVIRFEIK